VQRDSQEVRQQQSTTRASVGNRRTAMKVLQRKSQGVVLVYELEPMVVGSGPRILCFESIKSLKQVEQFPDDWRRLSDEDLIAIQKRLA
jgi:hypothetical protein